MKPSQFRNSISFPQTDNLQNQNQLQDPSQQL